MEAAPKSNVAGWTNVWAKDLKLGMQTTGGRITLTIVHADGSASIKCSRSPRVQELPSFRFIAVHTGFKA